MKFNNTVLPERAAFALRLGVGILFGLAMAILGHVGIAVSVPVNGVPAAPPPPALWKIVVYSTLALTAFVWWACSGTMRRWSLVIWGLAATAVIAFLAWHQTQATAPNDAYVFFTSAGWLVLPLLFIANELASSGDQVGRPIAPYPTYFDQAWKHGVQLVLSLLFTGLFWAILWLGAVLLGFIGFHWLRDLLVKDWFALPASGAAMACAVQLGDVQDKLLTNVRALVLSVLSWLLPVIAAIGLLFLGSLCISGLEPLWKTKAATTTLLSASIAFVLLINAAYQQGDEERRVNIVMKWATRLACVLLLAFATLAAYSLWLRVNPYGLTPERVLAAAGVTIALLFGLGYAAAAVWPGRWLARVEGVNIAMAFVKGLIFVGLLTPVGDPARLSSDDQVARLQSGRISNDLFDWDQLRFRTGQYGREALKALAKSSPDAKIRAKASEALAADVASSPKAVQSDDMSRLKVVSPAGARLPATFNGPSLETGGLRTCVSDPSARCTAAMIDLNADGVPEVVVLNGSEITVFRHLTNGWQIVPMSGQYLDGDGVKAFNAGQVMTKPHAWSDLEVGGTRLIINGDK